MCGIFGIINLKNAKLSFKLEHAVGAALTLNHRGPDGFNYINKNRIFFGHNRLSIVDPFERSNQPMEDTSERFALVFNGEIYNYIQLRKRLSLLGHSFRTQSDTEVLLHAYMQWRERLLEYIEGDYAFAIYDQKSETAFLARDAKGVKPLFYAVIEDQLVFSSTPVAISYYSQAAPTYNYHAVTNFLSYRTTAADTTLLAQVKRLKPGHSLSIASGNIQLSCFDRLSSQLQTKTTGKFNQNTLSSAVVEQQIQNESIALLLSGGLDSSILAYEFSQIRGNDTTCYIGRVANSMYDESIYAIEVAKHLGLPYEVVDIQANPELDSISQLISVRHAPLAMHNELAMSELASHISGTNKVMYTGEGADELFYGYGRLFRSAFDVTRVNAIRKLPKNSSDKLCKILDLSPAWKSLFDVFNSRYTYFPRNEFLPLLNDRVRFDVQNTDVALDEIRSIFKRSASLTPTQSIAAVFLDYHLRALLDMVDGVSMAHGVEARVPYLNQNVITAACQLNDNSKLKWKSPLHFLRASGQPISEFSERCDTPKWVLKKRYSNSLPKSVVNRPKMGFPVPLMQWAVHESVRALIMDRGNSYQLLDSCFDLDRLRQWFISGANNPSYQFANRVWLIVNLELFARHMNNLPKTDPAVVMQKLND